MKKVLLLNQLIIFAFLITSCTKMKDPGRPALVNEDEGYYFTSADGSRIFIRDYVPVVDTVSDIYIISGITGINHKSEGEVIEVLSSKKNRVIVIHPRGTGYSDGKRGDTDPDNIIEDYCEIIKSDSAYLSGKRKILLYGHSMSCALTLEVAIKLSGVDGIILVNPPYKLKPARGMSPKLSEYLKYAGYYLFAPHVPVVNMAGDPSAIRDESDRLESLLRINDSLLVKYFSMRCMIRSKKIMNKMINNARQIDIPLLLLYGENDNIVDKSGCDEIYNVWRCEQKSFVVIKDGSHGKSTVVKGAETIKTYINNPEAL